MNVPGYTNIRKGQIHTYTCCNCGNVWMEIDVRGDILNDDDTIGSINIPLNTPECCSKCESIYYTSSYFN